MTTITRTANLKITGGNSTIIRDIKDQLNRNLGRGNPRTLNAISAAIRENPATQNAISRAVRPATDSANEFLGAMVQSAGATLDREGSFPTSVLQSGTKQIAINKQGRSQFVPTVISSFWESLRESYLQTIGILRKRGSNRNILSGSTKHFWYERRRAGSKSRSIGPALGQQARQSTNTLSRLIQTSSRRAISGSGIPNKFTVSRDILTKGRVVDGRQRKGRSFIVFKASGPMVGPSVLTFSRALDRWMNRITLDSLVSGRAQSTGVRPKTVIDTGGRGNWLALLLANETRRPWVSAFFAKGKKGLTQHIRKNLANQ